MSNFLIRYDLTLPNYFTYGPAPGVSTKPMIPRNEERGLFMRGEFGTKPDGAMRPIVAHNTTHLDVPYHFLESGSDLSQVLNRPDSPADRPCLARVVSLGGQAGAAGSHTRDGITYCESVTAEHLPSAEILSQYEVLVLLTGFGAVMAGYPDGRYTADDEGGFHVPHLADSAVDRILESGLKMVALDSTTVEPQTQLDPVRFGSDVHFRLLGNQPPVLIVEGLGGGNMAEAIEFSPDEALIHVVPRRVNEVGADAAHCRVLLYVYRDDADGSALRNLAEILTPEAYHG